MGMFDRIYDERGNEWQTKAFACNLDSYQLGDKMPAPLDYQVGVLGGGPVNYVDSFAIVRGGYLAAVPSERDETLPLLTYGGFWTATSKGE